MAVAQSAMPSLQEYLNHQREHVHGLRPTACEIRLCATARAWASWPTWSRWTWSASWSRRSIPRFAALYRLLHASRMPRKPEATEESADERHHQQGIESGSRIREKLRLEVKKAMETLGQRTARHNPAFAEAAVEGRVRECLLPRCCARCTAHAFPHRHRRARHLVHPEPANEKESRGALSATCTVAAANSFKSPPQAGLARAPMWMSVASTCGGRALLSTFASSSAKARAQKARHRAPRRRPLRQAAGSERPRPARAETGQPQFAQHPSEGPLRWCSEQGALVAVNYNDLDVEELGSIYEGLLELHPVLDTSTGTPHFSSPLAANASSPAATSTRHASGGAADPHCAVARAGGTPERQTHQGGTG